MRHQPKRGAIVAPLMVGLGFTGVGSAVFALQSGTPMIPLWGVLGPVLGLVLLLIVWVVRTVKDSVVEIKVLQNVVVEQKEEYRDMSTNIQDLRDWKHNEIGPKVQVLLLDFARMKLDMERQGHQLDMLVERRQRGERP